MRTPVSTLGWFAILPVLLWVPTGVAAEEDGRLGKVRFADGETVSDARITGPATVTVTTADGDRTVALADITHLKQRVTGKGATGTAGGLRKWVSRSVNLILVDGSEVEGTVNGEPALTVRVKRVPKRTGLDEAEEKRLLKQLNASIGHTMTPQQVAMMKAQLRAQKTRAGKAEAREEALTVPLQAKATLAGDRGHAMLTAIDFTHRVKDRKALERIYILHELTQHRYVLEDLLISIDPQDRKRIPAVKEKMKALKAQLEAVETSVE